jgi:ParB family chromosome partitioning protein
MAKRRRLGVPLIASEEPAPETKAFPFQPAGQRRPPIAQVAGDAAALAAAEKLATEVQTARAEGRLVTQIPLDQVIDSHILRDRITLDAGDMAALKSSIAARGQQMPIEVVQTGQGGYGLISGLRRLTALRMLSAETGDARFARVKALIKPLENAPEAYLAMVEENEIRADLSFYERARLAHEAARQGVFETPQAAVKALYANTTPARRSKIMAFIALHLALGSALRFPAAIPEKLGLALVKAHEGDAGFSARLRARLDEVDPENAEAERRILDTALRPERDQAAPEEIAPGLILEAKKGRAVLSGKGVTPALLADLRDWLAARQGKW